MVNSKKKISVVAGISPRHVHLCQQDMETLFGVGYTLKKKRNLLQPSEFACEETVVIAGPKSEIKKVRVLGPIRKATQVEVSATDARILGVEPPIRISGELEGSAPIKIIGPNGTLELSKGCIIAKRHIHLSVVQSQELWIKDRDILSVKCGGERGLVFENVVARVANNMTLEFHIDTDEGNASSLTTGTEIEII
jgi:propanediol utilization protein